VINCSTCPGEVQRAFVAGLPFAVSPPSRTDAARDVRRADAADGDLDGPVGLVDLIQLWEGLEKLREAVPPDVGDPEREDALSAVAEGDFRRALVRISGRFRSAPFPCRSSRDTMLRD